MSVPSDLPRPKAAPPSPHMSHTGDERATPAEGHFALWDARAKRLVEQALYEWDTVEQHGNLSLALACLRVAEGDLSPDEFDGYTFLGEPEDESGCICPPDMLARGGFKGRCPVHGRG